MQMNSSTGFKKRGLLRPVSGVINKERQYLKSVDVSQSQLAIASVIRAEVASIQQEINLLDKDRRIRSSDSSLQKSYVTPIKKWLRDSQPLTEKQQDDARIIQFMGSDSYETAFHKLWIIACHLDLIICKSTQLQAIQLLLYDQMFQLNCKDSPRAIAILQGVAKTGFNISTFPLAQVLLQRDKQLFQKLSQARRKQSNSNNNNTILSETQSEAKKMIAKLESQNAKLSQALAELQLNKTHKTQQNQKNTQPQSSIKVTKTALLQVQDRYKEHITMLNSQISRLSLQLADTQTKLIHANSQLKQWNASNQSKAAQAKPKSGSYQETLLEQMESMRQGFQRRVKILTDEFIAKQKQLRKREIDLKAENQRNKWEKSLILKKYQALSK